MAKKQTSESDIQPIKLMIVVVIVAVLGLLFFVSSTINNSENVFWGMVDNNLSSFGVTRSIKQNDGNVEVDRKVRLVTAPDISTLSLTKITQKSGDASTEVVTENLVTLEDNLSRYVSIKSDYTNKGKKPNYDQLTNVWFADESTTPELNAQVLADVSGLSPGYLPGSPPFLLLNSSARKTANQFIRDNNVYEPNFDQKKTVDVNGKKAYEYPVKVDVKTYIELLSLINQSSGVEVRKINSENFKDNPPLDLIMTIDVSGRQLLAVRDNQTGREETFSAHGARPVVEIPEVTSTKRNIESSLEKLFK